jgi:uncharacterized membrane protein YgdD (TMEM256/DUF423 family)
MNGTSLLLAGVMGFLGVALGAFGAHGLRSFLAGKPDGDQRLTWWQTGAQYHLVHALAIGLAAVAAAGAASWLFLGGIVLFSGSLYLMTLTGKRALGAVTPIGGLLFLAGWVAIVLAAVRPGP